MTSNYYHRPGKDGKGSGKVVIPEREEIWVDIAEFKGKYMISTHQRVKNISKNPHFILSPVIHPLYKRATFNLCGKRRMRAVIMAKTFIPNPLNLETVNHINGDKLDDRIENLEWLSRPDNLRHAHRIGIFSKPRPLPYHAKKVIQLSLTGKMIATYDTMKAAGRATGIQGGSISQVCRGAKVKWVKDGKIGYSIPKQAGGFKWKFA